MLIKTNFFKYCLIKFELSHHEFDFEQIYFYLQNESVVEMLKYVLGIA